MTDTITDSIRSFIIDSFLFGDTSQVIADDMSLIDNNLIDSTGVLEVIPASTSAAELATPR